MLSAAVPDAAQETMPAQAQPDASASDEMYRAMFNIIAQGIVFQDANGSIIDANPAAERILGSSLAQLRGRTSMDPIWNAIHEDGSAFPGETHPSMVALANRSQITGVIMGVHNPTDQTYHWIRINAVPLYPPGQAEPYQVFTTIEDITEQRRTANATRENEAQIRFRSKLLDIVEQAVIATDLEGKIIYWNRFAEELYGWSALEATGQSVINLVPLNSSQVQVEAIMQRLRQGEKWSGEFLVKRRDGTEFPAQVTDSPIYDATGKLVGIVGVSTDISARKEAERTLRAREQRFQALVEKSYDGISLLGAQGQVLEISPAGLKILGYKKEELEQYRSDLIHPDDLENNLSLFRFLVAHPGESVLTVYRFLQKDGTWKWLEMAATNHLQDPSVGGIILNYRDVSERKRAEQALIASEERFRALIENSADAITLVSPEGVVLYNTSATDRIIGAFPETGWLYGNWLNRVHPEDLPAVAEKFTKLVQTPGGRFSTTIRYRHNDGSWLWVEGTATNLLDEPSVGAIIFNYRDVTRRKRVQDALHESEAQYRTLFESNPNPMWVYDLETLRFLAVNDAAVDHYGYTPDEFLAMTVKEIRPPQDIPLFLKDILEATTGFEESKIRRHLKKDGTIIDVEIISHQIDWRERPARLVLVNDVTARKKAETELAHERNLLRTVVDNLPDLIYAKDTSSRFVLSNLATAAQMGVKTPQELEGKTDADFYHGDVAAQFYAVDQEVMRTGEPILDLEESFIDPLKRQGFLSTSKIPLRDKYGTVIGLVGIGHDITQRKQAQAETQRRANEFSKLYETARELALQQDLASVLSIIAERLANLLETPASALLLYDALQDDLELVAATNAALPIGGRIKPGEGVSGMIAQTRQPIVANDVIGWSTPSLVFGGAATSQVGVPMVHVGELIGVLTIATLATPQQFSDVEIRLLGLFASLAGSAIYNVRLLAETRTRARQLGLLYDAGLTLNRVLDLHSQLEFLLQIGMKAVSADRAEYYRFDKEQHALRLEVCVGYAPEQDQKIRAMVFDVDDSNALVCRVARDRVPAYVPRLAQDPHWEAIDPGVQSALFVPVEHENELLGIFGVMSTRVQAFTPHDERLLVLFANQAAVALENARLFAQIHFHNAQMQALRTIDDVISSSLDMQISLQVLLDQVSKQLQVDAADVYLFSREKRAFEFAAEWGFRAQRQQPARMEMGRSRLTRPTMERKIIFVQNLLQDQEPWKKTTLIEQEGFISYAAAPLIAKGQVKGVLELFMRSEFNPNAEWFDFFGTLAKQAAIAVDNVQLFEDLQRSNLSLEMAYDSTIEGWSHALDLRDKETEGHTQRVTEMTLQLATIMGLSNTELVHIRRGALLHDIGKMGVPDAILLKPGALTDEEWQLMRMHPVYAFEWLSPIDYLRPALDIPYAHHERWDGNGYPRGLKGEQIPFVARIFSVIDVWDALRSDRPYRPAWSADKAKEYLFAESGKQFDPEIVQSFFRMLKAQT